MKILIAVDSSPVSQRVLEEVVARPWPPDTSFCVASAVDVVRYAELPAIVADDKRVCERIVKEGVALLSGANLSATSLVLTGSPRHVISSCASEWGASMIIAGSHGRRAVGRFFLGSVAQGILRTAHCSVEIVRFPSNGRAPSSHPMNILLATDGTEFSQAAVHSVAARPWPVGTVFQLLSVEDLVVMHADVQAGYPASLYPPGVLQELLAVERTRVAKALAAANEILSKAGLKTTARQPLPLGDPRSVILDSAEIWPADLIVLGSHGRRGMDRLLLGSVAESVAVHAHCSVEVIRK